MLKRIPHLNRDFLKRFKAIRQKAWAHDIDLGDTLFCETLNRRLCIGLQPLGGPKTALKCHKILVIRQPKVQCESASRLVRVLAVWIAHIDTLLGQTMKAHHQLLWPAMLSPKSRDLIAQRLDKRGVRMKALNKTHRGLVAQTSGHLRDSIHHGGGCAGGVLWIKGHHQDVLAATVAQRHHGALDRRIAIAHARLNLDREAPFSKDFAQTLCLSLGIDQQRRTLLHPNTLITRRELAWTRQQYRTIQNRPP